MQKVFGGRLGAIESFARGKLSPGLGAAMDILSGEMVTGEETTLKKELINNFIFMWVQDVMDGWYQWGPDGFITVGAPSFLGASVSTYKTKWRQRWDKFNKLIESVQKEKGEKASGIPEPYKPY